MVSDERLRELEERYEGYTVVDNAGDKIGKVDDLFVDDVDNEEYIGVKMGLFGLGGTTLIPMELCQADDGGRRIQVNDTKEHVTEAPNFRDDDDITIEYEARIREHFGLSGSAPSGDRGTYGRYEGTGGGGATAGVGAAGGAGTAGVGGREDRDTGDDRYSSRPEGGAQDTGYGTSGAAGATGGDDDDRFAGAAMGGINRKEQAPIGSDDRPADRDDDHEPAGTSPGDRDSDVIGTGGGSRVGTSSDASGAASGSDDDDDRSRLIGDDPDVRSGEAAGLSGGGQRGDYDRGYDEGYRRAQEELRSQSGGGSGVTGDQPGGSAGYETTWEGEAASGSAAGAGEGGGSRTRVRRRIRRLV